MNLQEIFLHTNMKSTEVLEWETKAHLFLRQIEGDVGMEHKMALNLYLKKEQETCNIILHYFLLGSRLHTFMYHKYRPMFNDIYLVLNRTSISGDEFITHGASKLDYGYTTTWRPRNCALTGL